jgi:2-oxoglutarate ferredoxin oxidoreductase subunit beta
VREAIDHPGFALIEVISACPVIYGRLNKKGGPPQMLKDMRDNSVPLSAAEKLPPEKLEGKIIRGVLRKEIKPEFCASYADLVKRVQEMGGEK